MFRHVARILPYARPYWRLALACATLTLCAASLGLLAPWPLKILIDSVIGSTPMNPTLQRFLHVITNDRTALGGIIIAGGVAIVLLENVFNVINSYVQTKLEQRMVLDLRADLFRHAMRLPPAYYDGHRAGGLIYAINYQADAAASLLMVIPQLAHALVTLVGMFWISWWIDSRLATLSLIVIPLLFVAVRHYATRIQVRLRHTKMMEGESLSIIHEAISMIKIIAAFGREDHEHRRFRTQAQRAVDARVKVTVGQTLFSLAVNLVTAVGTALVLAVGAHLVISAKLTVGQLVVVMAYIAAIYKPLETISYTVGSIQDMLVNLQIAFELLATDPQIKDAPSATELTEPARGRVTFDGIDFSYSGRTETLKGISFDAHPGDTIAIVGPTGAGKTTIVSLIPRFYEADHGRILIDGKDIREIKLASLRKQVSVVQQEPLLFSGSIADNIRYGKLDASDEQVFDAARRAGAHDFISRLPQGYETLIGERGAQVSGGERQRICIARAFVKDSPILILDEPTSAVDSKTESTILASLADLMQGRTTFVIAHRLSTIRNADLILVVDRGRMVQQGRHDDLLARDGMYRQLYESQAGQYREEETPLVT